MPPIAVTDLSRLFLQTADAAVRAQGMLDTYSLERTRVYAIPGVNVSAKFALAVDARTGLLALLFGSASEQTTHSLQFALRAAPEAPPAGDLTADLPGDRRTVCEPPWVVAVPEREHLADVLTLALRMNRVAIQVPDVPGPVDFFPEAQAIDEALRNTDDDSIGVVFFRLSASPEEYLIVRVGDAGVHNGHDGIFVLKPGDETQVRVFDFLTSPKRSTISYRPMEQLFTVFTEWLADGLPSTQLRGDNIPATFGSIRFAEFAQGMWVSYVAARKTAAGLDASQQPVYALSGVTAEFAHAVPPPNSRADGEDASPYIYSRVALRIAGDRLTGRLVCPEYLLVEDARAAFIAQLVSHIDEIAGEAEDIEQETWRSALNNSHARAAALITLSYRGADPKNEFLVVFPAAWNGRQSSFAFTCAIDKNGLKDVVRCKSLADDSLDRDSYVGFHNFWHSVRIWEMAGGWFVDR